MPLPARYLQVTLDLPNDDHQTQMFDQYLFQLLPTFQQQPWPGWELYLSAVRDESRDPSSATEGKGLADVKSYLNVWRVRDYNSLPYLMEYFDDDEVYRHLDAMVLREAQHFTEELMFHPGRGNPDFAVPKAGSYVTMELDMLKDPKRLEDFDTLMLQLAGPASTFLAEHQMQLIHGAYAQTGRLDRYFLIWATRAMDFKGAMDWLRSQPAFAGALDTRGKDHFRWWVWEPKSYGVAATASA